MQSSKAVRKFKPTTNSKHNLPVFDNLLQQDFSSTVENGFQHLPLLSAEFSSPKIYMCNNINTIAVSYWKI